MSALPSPSSFIGRSIPETSFEIQDCLGKGANAIVFRAYSAQLARTAACKIIPRTNLRTGSAPESQWQREIHAANSVQSNRVVKIFGMGSIDDAHIYLLQDYVKGESLKDYIKKSKTIEIPFIVDFIKTMLSFLHQLKPQTHGDLHAGNILVEDQSSSLEGRPYDFRVTDFGVAPFVSGSTLLDDLDEIVKIIRDMLSKVEFQDCNAIERQIYKFLRDDVVAKSFTERDITHSPKSKDPESLFHHIVNGIRRAQARGASGASAVTELLTPFEFVNCEQIGEAHKLLKDLYSDKMLGLPTIEERTNLILTGPRGCGKTTVFRCISLKHRVLTGDASPEGVKYLGVYYRCDDLYFAFPRYRKPQRIEAVDVPMHFMVSSLLRELLVRISHHG